MKTCKQCNGKGWVFRRIEDGLYPRSVKNTCKKCYGKGHK